jgi:predicted Zn-dependent protease
MKHLPILALLLAPLGAAAQVPGVVPREIVLYVHENMPRTDFVEPLVCALERAVVARVRAEKFGMPIDRGLLGSPTELSSEQVLGRLHQQTGAYAGTVVFLLLPYPILSQGRPVFGANYGAPYNKGVVSVPSLALGPPGLSSAEATDLVVRRTYKVLLRYVGQIGGLWRRNECVMMMPHGLDELDGKPSEFCDDDRATLVTAGVLKEMPSATCSNVISSR